MKEITLPSGSLLRFIDDLRDDGEREHRYELWTEMATEPEELDGIHAVMVQNKITDPPGEWVKPYIDRGLRVHSATERHDLGLPIDPAWLASPERVYLDSYVKFIKAHPEFSCDASGIECLRGSEDAGMATVVDRIPADRICILQIKTGQPNPKVHAVQMAFEGLMAFRSSTDFMRYAVYLTDDGEAKLMKYEDDESMDVAVKIMAARIATRRYMTTRRKATKRVKV